MKQELLENAEKEKEKLSEEIQLAVENAENLKEEIRHDIEKIEKQRADEYCDDSD